MVLGFRLHSLSRFRILWPWILGLGAFEAEEFEVLVRGFEPEVEPCTGSTMTRMDSVLQVLCDILGACKRLCD